MEHSTLKPLLPELRLRIYHLVLWDPNPITIDFDYYGRCTRIGGQHHLLALTETCRFIRNEALPEFYAYNNFLALIGNLAGTAGFNDVHPPRYEGGIPRFRQWLEEIGFENAKRIRRIEIQSFLRTNTSALVNPRLASRLLRPVTDFFAGTGECQKHTRKQSLDTDDTLFLMTQVLKRTSPLRLNSRNCRLSTGPEHR